MAATDANRIIKNAAYRVYWVVKDNTTFEPITGGLNTAAVEKSVDGAAFAACTDTPHELGTTGTGYTELTVAEMTADHVWFRANSADATAIQYEVQLHPEPASDSGLAQSATASTIVLRAAANATNDYYNGQTIEIVRGTGIGQFRTITDYVGSSKTATVKRDWVTNPDNTSVYKVHLSGPAIDIDGAADANVQKVDDQTDAAVNLAALYLGGLTIGSVEDASPTTTVFDGETGLSSTDDYYQYSWLLFTSGANEGIMERISDYVGSTRQFTMQNAFPAVPADEDTFVILGKAR